jgi:adenylate kinase
MDQQSKINAIKPWLGSGSINIFGLPFSGKDTVGARLAEALDAKLLSSGDILRAYGEKTQESGSLTPIDVFQEVVLPHLHKVELKGQPLVLSSIGRWIGEEQPVIEAAKEGGHEIKAVLYIKIDEDELYKRDAASEELHDRDGREDDAPEKLALRISEFNTKTMPVIRAYRQLGLLTEINGKQSRDEVFAEVISALYELAQ